MPVEIYIPTEAGRSGICISYTKTSKMIDIYGWYDSFVGIEGKRFTLKEFLDQLGITKKDCLKCFEDYQLDKKAK